MLGYIASKNHANLPVYLNQQPILQSKKAEKSVLFLKSLKQLIGRLRGHYLSVNKELCTFTLSPNPTAKNDCKYTMQKLIRRPGKKLMSYCRISLRIYICETSLFRIHTYCRLQYRFWTYYFKIKAKMSIMIFDQHNKY